MPHFNPCPQELAAFLALVRLFQSADPIARRRFTDGAFGNVAILGAFVPICSASGGGTSDALTLPQKRECLRLVFDRVFCASANTDDDDDDDDVGDNGHDGHDDDAAAAKDEFEDEDRPARSNQHDRVPVAAPVPAVAPASTTASTAGCDELRIARVGNDHAAEAVDAAAAASMSASAAALSVAASATAVAVAPMFAAAAVVAAGSHDCSRTTPTATENFKGYMNALCNSLYRRGSIRCENISIACSVCSCSGCAAY